MTTRNRMPLMLTLHGCVCLAAYLWHATGTHPLFLVPLSAIVATSLAVARQSGRNDMRASQAAQQKLISELHKQLQEAHWSHTTELTDTRRQLARTEAALRRRPTYVHNPETAAIVDQDLDLYYKPRDSESLTEAQDELIRRAIRDGVIGPDRYPYWAGQIRQDPRRAVTALHAMQPGLLPPPHQPIIDTLPTPPDLSSLYAEYTTLITHPHYDTDPTIRQRADNTYHLINTHPDNTTRSPQ